MLRRILFLLFKAIQVGLSVVIALPHLIYYILTGKDTWEWYDKLGWDQAIFDYLEELDKELWH